VDEDSIACYSWASKTQNIVANQPKGPQPAIPDLEREVALLYEENSARLVSYAHTLIRNRDAARDAVQEVFLRYFAERRYGNHVENPRAWLYRVLHNYLMDQLQSPSSKYEVPAEGALTDAAGEEAAECLMEQTQIAQQIVSRLTPRELDCLRLRAQGLSYGQIAEKLGIRAGTVGALLPRVYSKLRQDVAEGLLVHEGTAGALELLLRGGQAYVS